MTITALVVLEHLGFVRDASATDAPAPAHRFDLGNGEVTAITAFSPRSLREVVHIGGQWWDGRSLGLIDFEVPTTFASLEEGVAWIAFGLTDACRPTNPVAWLDQGRAWRHHLPWERKRIADLPRARCCVLRDWFRPIGRQLATLGAEATPTEIATLGFDGEVLTVRARDHALPMPASGDPWPDRYGVPLRGLQHLPRRLMMSQITVEVWQNRLFIDRLSLPLSSGTAPWPNVETPRHADL